MELSRNQTYRVYRRRMRRWAREIAVAVALTVAAATALGIAWLSRSDGARGITQADVQR